MGRRERKKEKKKQAVVTWILIALMILSVMGIFLGAPASQGEIPTSLDYEDSKFEIVNNYYVTDVDGRNRRFYFHPLDLLRVEMPAEAMQAVSTTPIIVFTFDPEMKDIESAEVSRYQLQSNLDKTVYSAVTKESDVYQYPIVTCKNATKNFPVVYVEQANKSGTTYEEGCVVIRGQGIDLIQNVERMIYQLLGVMDG